MGEIERRALGEVRAAGEGRKLQGYAALYNSETKIPGLGREVIRPGAFTRALREGQDVRLLVNHEPSQILARTRNGTLRLREDERGLAFEADLPDTQLARDVLELVRRGDLSQMSFAFRVKRDNWSPDGLRELLDVDLFDVSVVTYPAYEETTVTARSRKEAGPMPWNFDPNLHGTAKPSEEERLRQEAEERIKRWELDPTDTRHLRELTGPELRAQLQRYLEGLEEIETRAERFGRDLTRSEQEQVRLLRERVKAAKDALEYRKALGIPDNAPGVRSVALLQRPGDFPGAGVGAAGTPAVGGELRALRPDERLSDVVSRDLPDGIRPEELSLGRMLRGLVTGDWKGAEAERRALGSTPDTLGGYLVPSTLSARIIDLARNQARVIQAGAQTLPMETAQVTLARVEGDPTAYWRGEHAAITESDMAFGAINLKARTLAAMVRVSVELLEDALNLSQVVENALSQALALELDRAALFGSGTGDEPLGLRNWTGVNVVDLGANGAAPTFADFSKAVQKIWERNGPDAGLAVIMAPRTAGDLDRLTDSTGQPLRPPASFEALRKLVTNQVPVNLTKGTATNASVAFVGAFSELLIGARTNLTIEASRQAGDAFGKLQVLVRAYLRADVAVMRPEWFTVVDGIIPAA